MAADCWLCRRAVPAVRNTVGSLDHPIGVCAKCNSLCCGHHGHRSSKPAFLCILCDASLKASSAGWRAWVNQGGLSTLQLGAPAPVFEPAAGSRLATALVELFPPGSELARAVVGSLEEWARGRPAAFAEAIQRFADELVRLLDRVVAEPLPARWPRPGNGYSSAEVADCWRLLDPAAKRLLAAAVVLVRLLQVEPAELPAALRAVVEFAAPLELPGLAAWRSDVLERTGDD